MSDIYEKTLNIIKNDEEQNIGLFIGNAPSTPALGLNDTKYIGNAKLFTEETDVSNEQTLVVKEDEGYIPLFTDACDIQNSTGVPCLVIKDGETEVFARIITPNSPSFLTLSADGNTYAINKKAEPITYRKMTAIIDLTDSNPETCITYADDAEGMIPGSDDWDEFFGHYPVLFKNGEEVGKLNKNNFAQFEDGTAADITSGDAGDVMIAFPRRGLTISTSQDGNTITVSMTDNPLNSDFKYYAHQRGTTDKDVFYLGAYKGYESSSKLRSLSGKTPTASKTIGAYRTLAQANGSGYEQSGFYQLVFRQAMYILKYKSLDSQTAIGRGYVEKNSAMIATGGTETKGMDWGETTGKQHMKLFGLEDFWGNIWEWVDGCVTDANRNILTVTDNFNDAGTGYTSHASGVTSNIANYMNKPQGTTETGFLAKEVNGSATTYFCDCAYLSTSCVAMFGGDWIYASYIGAFHLGVFYAASSSHPTIASRLMYL